MNIKLFCSGGVTAGTLTEAMKKICGPDDKIAAYDFNQLDTEVTSDVDCVLIAPQIRYRLAAVKQVCESRGVPFDVIEPIAVGRLDGARILAQAKKLVENR